MCGITGIYLFNEKEQRRLQKLKASTDAIHKRGPDAEGFLEKPMLALGHRRLSIIDTSDHAIQPMTDATGRYHLIFNGEIFNYKELKQTWFPNKTNWQSQSDTEVLLELLILKGAECLPLLSGFFAFALYDTKEATLVLARDRLGKKPLYIYRNEDYLAFASEMKALLAYEIPKKLNHTSLYQYLQLNYVPQPASMWAGVEQLKPGHLLKISRDNVTEVLWYRLPIPEVPLAFSYETACSAVREKLEASVKRRMISDVPLGAFLSGGIDSSVVVALAARHTRQLNTFSIGYKNQPFYDETAYAELVARKYKTNHTVFALGTDDFLEHIHGVMDYMDEPFADSSAIPTYILSLHTRKHVTVALSGDGGDEVFAGYHKHAAEFRMRQKSILNSLVRAGAPLWKMLPHSRSNPAANLFRQLHRFSEGASLSAKDRYWRWASLLPEAAARNLLSTQANNAIDDDTHQTLKRNLLQGITGGKRLEDFLATDLGLVLLSDMLVKVDRMSMANSLEVRSPFLDHEVVELAFALPTAYKINSRMKKRIVQDAFRGILPPELYDRPKKGFEIPIQQWFRKELASMVDGITLSDGFIKDQGLFNPQAVQQLKKQLFSNTPGDSHASIWALLVFQHWWNKYFQ